MNNRDINTLLDKLASGSYTAAEELQVQRFIHRYNNEGTSGLTDEDFLEAEDEMWQVIEKGGRLKVRRMLWWKPAIAAAMATIIFGAGLFFYKRAQKETTEIFVYKNDIAPGKNSAILTLANGKTISLSDAKTGVIIGNDLTYNDGSAVANLSPSGRDGVAREGSNNNNPLSPQGGSLPEGERSKVQTLIASTPRGGTYKVTLSDGTNVWLNADSKISFPSQFSGKERKILLSGEAYFEVARVIRISPSGRDGHRPERVPFIVESKGQKVEVLGTHFNINAYNDEASVKTTLLEGSVRVVSLSSIILKPNQQAINNGNVINVKQVDPELAIAWKNKQFLFESEQIQTIMRMVERWYNVEVIYSDEITKDTFSGGVSRFDNLSEVLKSLESTGKIHFRIEGRKVYVTR